MNKPDNPKCVRCGGDALYQAYGELLCRDCLVDEYGLCAVCGNCKTCDDRPQDMVLSLCSNFEEIEK